jgi:hypothetical protein
MENKINEIRKLLNEETDIQKNRPDIRNRGDIGFISITHNKEVIFLQMCGWSINLYKDGTWNWEDTTGG